MKGKILASLVLFLCTSLTLADPTILVPTQNPDATYRLFNTQNIYTLLKLDTREGLIWQVQWGDKAHRFVVPLNLVELALGTGKPGRFTLYPTSNIYTFILLDQETGSTWYVQWGKADERFVVPIE